MSFKFQLGDHMVKAGFPSGDLTPAHMLPFKHLKARLGLLCLTAFTNFIDLKKFLPGRDQHLSSWNWSSVKDRPAALTSLPFACVSSCMNLLIEMGLFSYLSSASSSLCHALPKLAKLESPVVLTNLHFLQTCGLPK